MNTEETVLDTEKTKFTYRKMSRLVKPYLGSYVLLGLAIFVSAWVPVGYAEGIRRVFHAVLNRSFDQLWLAAAFYAGLLLLDLVLGIVKEWGKQSLHNRTTLDWWISGKLASNPS